MKRLASVNSLILLPLAALVLPGIVRAQQAMTLQVQELELENGLVVLVVERHNAPVFSSYIVTGVGSANEKPGTIGAAHLLEHMLFKGTRTIGTKNYRDEQELMDKQDSLWNRIDRARRDSRHIRLSSDSADYSNHLSWIQTMQDLLDSLIADESLYVVKNEWEEIYSRRGAVGFNASTWYDFTDYIVSLPANQLEVWFAMEADRMKNPVLREFYAERDVTLEERRLKIDNEGEGKLFEQFIATAFVAHPYQLMWEWKSDQGNLKRGNVKRFHEQHYAPNRTVVALVGDVAFAEVKRLAEKYWTDIPRRPEPDPIYTIEPEQLGERRVDVRFDASAVINIGFHKGAFDDLDEATFEVIDRILADGRSSRLYKALVIDKQLCSNISTSAFPGAEQGDLYPNLYVIEAYPKEGVGSRTVEKAIYAELARLASKKVSGRELEKAQNNFESEFIWAFYSNSGLAQRLARYQLTAQDWRFMLRRRAEIAVVTAEMIQKSANKYFTESNRTVATLIPTPGKKKK
ncbi:MAG: M16 family metallopeptidase [Candidatus Zixiibacteriota bacterium]